MSDTLTHWLGLTTIVLAAIALAWWPAAGLVRGLLDRVKPDVDDSASPPELDPWKNQRGLGLWIGRLERSLMVLLLIAGAPTAVGLVVAAKSILRFPEITSDKPTVTAEYVLVGSLASWGIAVAIGYTANQLISQLPPA
jgi:hypothetical protein